ncbi:MAG: M14 metallopeptidase family protein [Saprospiraceae bacterium]
MKGLTLIFALLTLAPTIFFAQRLQSPGEFLPHTLGEQFTTHAQLVSYVDYVAASRPKTVKRFQYGRTIEERPQLLIAISSEENIANLEKIRLNNLKTVGLERGTPDNLNPIAIVWLGYSVHGNEPAGSESSMKVIYELSNGERADVQSWLKNTVVLIDPSENPDGYERYSQWYRQVSGKFPNIDMGSLEHQEPWPGGRVNHYLFDLNRDWAWATQQETRNRIKMYKQWMPHVHPDLHEMGSNEPYYFAPASEPFHKYISDFQRQFQVEIGKNHTRYFDANGWLYFTKEVFDLFYPSYGDTYPTFNGAIGMTYEQGGGGAGRGMLVENGDTLTLKDRIEHHYTTSMSTIEISSMNARRLVVNFQDYFKNSIEKPIGTYKTFVIKATNDRNKLEKLTQFLDLHKIQYGSTSQNSKVLGFNYISQKEDNFEISEKDLIISVNQPFSILAQVLFDPESVLVDSLTYDITSWAIPYSWGLESFATKQAVNVKKSFSIEKIAHSSQNNTPYAFIFPWKSVSNVKFLGKLLQKGVVVRKASFSFQIEGKDFSPGTLIVTRADNNDMGPSWSEILRKTASEEQQDFSEVNSGLVSSGPDFGSSKVKIIKAPKVLICSGEGVNANAFGHVWNYFDNDIEYQSTITSIERLKKMQLTKFDVLVLADGSYNFDGPVYEKLKTWVSSGGRLILMEEAIAGFEEQKGFSISKYADKKEKDAAEEKIEKESLNSRLESYCDRERRSISSSIPGAIFKLKLDSSHPLAFGLPDYYFSLRTNTLFYSLLKEGSNVGRIDGEPAIIGFAGSKVKPRLSNTLVFGVQPIGKGYVTYLVDSPVFRGFWEQGKLLFGNAIFMNAE